MPKFWNIVKANAEIESGHTAVDALLVSAKITTIKVDGKDVPAADAPLALKIAALGALAKAGDATQETAQLIASNGQLAAQIETLTSENTTAKATIAANNQKISGLETDLAAQKASVQSLTAELTTANTNLKASNTENVRLTGEANKVNAELSKQCLAVNCLTLSGEDGKPLAKDAPDAQKLEAANKIPVGDKLTALMGAVHSAAASIGVQLHQVTAPATAANKDAGKKLSADEQIRRHQAQGK